jgi:hypothetical protein
VAAGRLRHHVLTAPPRRPAPPPSFASPSASTAPSSCATVKGKKAKGEPSSSYKLSLKWRAGSVEHPLATELALGRCKAEGWRRDAGTNLSSGADDYAGKAKKMQLTPEELVRLSFEVALLSPPPAAGCMRDLEHAWGVSPGYGVSAAARCAERGLSGGRQQRSDAGRSMVTDPTFAASKCTALEQFVREQAAQPSAGFGGGLDRKALRAEFEALEAGQEVEYEQRADLRRQRAPFWLDEIKVCLQQADGKVPWTVVANACDGDLSVETVRRYVMSLEGFSYKAVTTVPLLGDGHVRQRLEWALAFWVFWHEAKRLGKKMLLVHADEKWFWACVARRKNKSITEFGVEPKDFKVQHKSHIFKIMACAVSACLFESGDIECGGKGFKVAFERCGDFEKAKRTTRKRRYLPDGKWKMDGEISRKEGDDYFVSHEVTGACQGGKVGGNKATRCDVCKERGSACTKQKKWSTLAFLRDTCIPELEKICSKEGCIVRWQFDGAGPHKDAFLLNWIDTEFRKRGWIFVFQPSQSPETNTKDACIFPSLSRDVSTTQAVTYGHNHVLREEELWRAMQQSWETLSCATIARSFAAHHQIVTAIIVDKGSNTYLRGKDKLHFGIRKRFVETPDGDGVQVLSDVPPAQMESYALKYPTPEKDITCATSRLNALEVSCLYGAVPWVPVKPPAQEKSKKRKAADSSSDGE